MYLLKVCLALLVIDLPWCLLVCAGNAAQRIHEKVRVAVRELRALPDFSHSPPCSGQKRSAFKRYRRKHSGKPSKPKSPRPCLSLTPRSPRASCVPSPQSPSSPGTPSCGSRTSDDYVEMKMVKLPTREREHWETGEEESGYMVMSPQPRYCLPVCPPEDYTPMESHEEEWSACPSHHMAINR